MRMISDSAARALALEPARSFAVRAPAGSGKTTLLTQRLLKLLATVDQPEQIVAITFTRKAAQEMRSRILAALELARGPEPDSEFERTSWELARAVLAHDAASDWNLVDNPARLRIMTIDALCQSLVRQMPITARFAGAPRVEENPAELYLEAARRALSDITSGSPISRDIAALLQHVDNDWRKLETLISSMLSRRDQWLPLLGTASERDYLVRSFTYMIGEQMAPVASILSEAHATEWQALAEYATSNGNDDLADLSGLPPLEADYVGDWQALVDLLLTREGAWRKQVNKNNGFPAGNETAKAMKARWAAFVAELQGIPRALEVFGLIKQLPEQLFGDGEWEIVSALINLLRVATGQLMVLTESEGRTDFTAISIAANAALGSPEQPTDLSIHLDYQIRHLLIDEFQDTSNSQFELLLGLTGGWSADDGRTLFIVGDPMQSIYRFRQAEVALFNQVMRDRRIGHVPVEPLTLTTNFRSQGNVVTWINQTMPSAIDIGGGDVNTFVAQDAARACGRPPVALEVYNGYAANAEADDVLECIAAIRQQNSGESIAVLVRSRTHLSAITRHLVAAGIAVQTREIEPLSELPYVADLLTITRALLHPGDRIAWLALLRAPWLGLSLDELETVAKQGDTIAEGVQKAAQSLTGDGLSEARIRTAATLVEELLLLRGRFDLVEATERAWRMLQGPDIVFSNAGDEQVYAAQLEDVRRYFDLLVGLQQEGAALNVERLESRVAEEFSIRTEFEADAVQIMTIHGAKGLEFDHVIIPGLGRPTRAEPNQLLIWQHERDEMQVSRLIVAPYPGPYESPLYRYLRWCDGEAMKQEAVRLLYVALTRAREQLHLMVHVRESNDGWQVQRRSLAAYLWPAVEPGVTEVKTPEIPLESNEEQKQTLLRKATPLQVQSLPTAQPGAVDQVIEFDWAGRLARCTGTAIHRVLQSLGSNEGAGFEWDATCTALALSQLRGAGVDPAQLEAAVAQVQAAVSNVFQSERGRWMFSADHKDVCSELGLSCVTGKDAGRVVIDRTFVDDHDQRWIVDFKSGSHGGGALEQWLDSEQARYREQLERYARIMRLRDSRPIMLGLYFPVVDAWREWRFGEDV